MGSRTVCTGLTPAGGLGRLGAHLAGDLMTGAGMTRLGCDQLVLGSPCR